MLFKTGTHEINETIVLPKAAGGRLVGEGMAPRVAREGHPLNGEGTRLIWTGEEGGTMVRLQGSHQTIQNLTLDGNGKAATGIHVDKPGRGLGTGKSVVGTTSLQDCTAEAVKFGEDEGTHNCDVMAFRDVYVDSCPTAFRCMNTMGMGHEYDNVFAYGVPLIFDYRAGGFVQVRSLSVTYGVETVLRTGKHGRNNGLFTFCDVKIDAGMPTPLLVEQTQTGSVRVRVQDLLVSYANSKPREGQPLFSLRPGSRLVLDNVDGLYAGCLAELPDHLGRRKIGGQTPRQPSVEIRGGSMRCEPSQLGLQNVEIK